MALICNQAGKRDDDCIYCPHSKPHEEFLNFTEEDICNNLYEEFASWKVKCIEHGESNL